MICEDTTPCHVESGVALAKSSILNISSALIEEYKTILKYCHFPGLKLYSLQQEPHSNKENPFAISRQEIKKKEMKRSQPVSSICPSPVD